MSLHPVVVIAAGSVLAAGSVVLWRYRRQVNRLINDLMRWINRKIKAFTHYAKEVFRAVAVTTRQLVMTAYESISNRWNSLSPEGRRMVAMAATSVVNAGINAAFANADDQIRLQFPNQEAPERQALEDLMSELRRFQSEHQQTMTSYLL